MRWDELQRDAGELGATARTRLEEPGVVLVATIRRDRTPRLSPCEPFFWDGDLWLPMMQGSQKVRDLRRDQRVLVHSIITTRDGDEGEVKVRGRVTEVIEPERRARLCAAIGAVLPWQPDPERVDPFVVDVDSVVHITYVDGDQYVTSWPAKRRFVRRLTSATSVGNPEELAYR